MGHTIVAFGDGNTCYFLGDENKCGPPELAWPAQMEGILLALGEKVTVRNAGIPGEAAASARTEFAATVHGADLCVVSFGSEDLRRPEQTMSGYLAEIEDVLRQGKSMGVPIILLGIPWCDEDWGGAAAQSRLHNWNEALAALCLGYGTPFVDLCAPFEGDPDRWYSERATPRHSLSAAAQRCVAELVLPLVMESIQ